VNVASAAGIVGVPNRAVYVASKFAIVGITKSIAADYAEYNIRCNVVCPGTVESPWISKILAADPDQETARKKLEARQLIKRMGTPEEIAYAILFLASPQAAFVHGSAMIIDGGWTAV
jgi:NAD(P)-dependent dehydrogenase (short-subunit alcohol dehydrogenase family)